MWAIEHGRFGKVAVIGFFHAQRLMLHTAMRSLY